MRYNSVTAFAAAAILAAAIAAPAFAQSGAPIPSNAPPRSATATAAPAGAKAMPAAKSAAPAADRVKAAQNALNRSGARLDVDGKMGPKTRAALKDYQSKNGLQATGSLDSATRAKLGVS